VSVNSDESLIVSWFQMSAANASRAIKLFQCTPLLFSITGSQQISDQRPADQFL